ncbi:MAG: twin-arginine translocation signal domain-containing protein [Rhodospirillaceae bacterium]|nr:twin-arginine translocation signal domain-containing protein [Rhodospirillaceae bacterium]
MSKTKNNEKNGIDRRSFLRGAGLGAGVVGAGAAVLASKPAAAAQVETAGKSAGYQETEHVRRAYEVAKF